FNITPKTRARAPASGSYDHGLRPGHGHANGSGCGSGHVAAMPLLLLLCCALLAPASGSEDTRCDAGQFRCRDGGCILLAKMCDGRGDCKDSSDELECDYRLCRQPHWFPCAPAHGACLAAELMCNGVDNCPGGEDELNCPGRFGVVSQRRRNCSAFEWTCQQDRACVPLELVCDGRADCGDRSDEEAGCRRLEADGANGCPPEGHLCPNGRCLRRKQWLCDGVDDCGDGSDEKGCANLCQPELGTFLCRNRETCLPLEKVCDGHKDCSDGSDEADDCHTQANCEAKKCPKGAVCHMLPSIGAECVCPRGFRKAKFDEACQDIDECQEQEQEQREVCSQRCKNTPGGYECTCDAGYWLASDNRTCRAVRRPEEEPLLLYTTQMTVMGMHLQEEGRRNHVFLVAGNLTKVIGVAYDGNYIYWTNIQNEAESLVRARGDGSHAEILLTSGLDAPEDLAVDWLTQNIYFSDNAMRHIAVCSQDGLNCAVLVTQDVHQPRSLALWPQRGLMFWTDWGTRPMIARASMDGTRSRPIVSDNIHWPNGIALDMHQPEGRIYWVDAKLGSVQSVRPDGSGRRTVLAGVLKHPYGLALFEDQLFWSDWATKSVHACHKFSGKQHRVIAKDRTIYAVHVYHRAKQPPAEGPHGCQVAQCSHLCLLAEPEQGGYSCACPDGMRLGPDHRRCTRTEKRQRLFVGLGQVVLEIDHTSFGRHTVTESHILACHVDEMVYNSVNGSLIIADNIRRSIFEYQTDTKTLNKLVTGLGNVSALAFDPLSRNLYWADAELGLVELLSLQTGHRALVRFFAGLERPVGLAVMPAEGYLYVVLQSRRHSHIDRFPLSGRGAQTHVIEDDLGDDDIRMAVDHEDHTIFWSDSDLGRIGYSNYRTVQPQIFRGKLRRPYAMALVGQDLFWSEMGSGGIFWAHKNNMGPRKRINIEAKNAPLTAPLRIPLAASTQALKGIESHPCQQQNGGCSHVCVGEGPGHTICLCPTGFVFRDAGNRTCVEALDCEFRCGSGECLTMAHRCNRHRDCVDGSDEANCDEEHMHRQKVMCSHRQFACHSGDQCVDQERRCNERFDCRDHSDEQHCEQFDKNKRCHIHQIACDNGKCVDQSLRCDGTNDCGDGSDELNCGSDSAAVCEPGMFRCSSGSCIAAGWECDGQIDCSDASDEHDKCGHRSCPPEMHRCLLGQCLDKSLVCNGHNDCGDGSDELNCDAAFSANISCTGDEFQCTSNLKICLPARARCNGTAECPRGEDEADCGDVCGILEFRCRSGGQCIRREFRCDGEPDCTDRSDELACDQHAKQNQTGGILPASGTRGAGRTCRANLFDCGDGECVDMSRVCNGFPDCTSGLDEGPQCATACVKGTSDRNVCHHKCRPTPAGAVCSCFAGYRLDADQRSCVDIDECQEQQPCAQLCENTLGSFQCQCHADFMLRPDRVSCKSLLTGSALLFSSYNEVRNMTEQPVMLQVAWSTNDSRISGFDVDVQRQTGYFSAEEEGLLYQLDLQSRRLRGLALDRPTKLSLDWATGNVYVLVGGSAAHEIQACSFEARMCGRVLRASSPGHLKHLAVDGYHSHLFYATLRSEGFGHSPESELHMSRLDGSRHELLLRRSDSYIAALATDPHQQHLYFVDLHSRTLERVGYRPRSGPGPQRRPEVMLQKSNALLQPSGLSMFENHAYIVNLGAKEAVRCRMFGSRSCKSININVLNAQDIVVAARSRQPQPAAHPCVHALCQGLCVQADFGYECMCGHDRVAEGERCAHGSGNEVLLATADSSQSDSESAQSGGFHWKLTLLILVAGSLVAGLGYMYFQYRRRGHRDLNINLHFQNPLATLG
ncbi:hypothetical protein KR018_010052, partial [Drosophila ironensis]